jgi:hypothetical protein
VFEHELYVGQQNDGVELGGSVLRENEQSYEERVETDDDKR